MDIEKPGLGEMKNQFQQGKFEGSLDVTLELSLWAAGGGERREGLRVGDAGAQGGQSRAASPARLASRQRTLTLGAHGGRLQSQEEQCGAERRQAAGRRPSRLRAHGGGVRGLRAAGETWRMLVPRPGMLRELQPGALGPANSRGSRWRHPGGWSPAPPLRPAPGSRGAKRGCARARRAGSVPPRGGRSLPRVDWAQNSRQTLL